MRVRSLLLASGCLLISAAAWACSTPVYRYAMYNWAPSPHYVFYFYRGEPAPEDREVNKLLAQHDVAPGEAFNLTFEAIDLAKKERFEQLPAVVRKAYEAHQKGKSAGPLHLMFTAWGTEFFAGRLDAATLRAMVDSPARTKIGELLDAGNAAVLVLLTDAPAKRAKKLEKLIDQTVARSAAEQAEAAAAEAGADGRPKPAAKPADGDSDDRDEPSGPAPLKFARITISPKDPAEKWLVKMLMQSDEGLEADAKQPMVFAVFGRGRILPPCIGEGISAENLTDMLAFVAGDCSCQIKDQNRGADLLMRWDWDATADRLAADDPDYDGGQAPYREVSAGRAPSEKAQPAPKSKPEAVAAAPKSKPEFAAAAPKPSPAAVPAPQDVADVETQASEYEQSFISRSVWTYGFGAGVATAAVLAAGWLLMRGKVS